MYHLTVDYIDFNAAALKETWPMPHIEAVLSDVRGSTLFTGMDFCYGYCQLPLAQ